MTRESVTDRIIFGVASMAIIALLGWGGLTMVDLRTLVATNQATATEKFRSIDDSLSGIHQSINDQGRYTGEDASRDRQLIASRLDELARMIGEQTSRNARFEQQLVEILQWKARMEVLMEREGGKP